MKSNRSHTSHTALAVTAAMLLPLVLGACTRARIPVTGIEVPMLNVPLPAILRTENDLRSRPWPRAFQLMHERIGREYAYTAEKGIAWDALYTEVAADVAAAHEAGDRNAWYLALRRYVHTIPDGNVQIDANDALREAEEGATVGLTLAELPGGTVMVGSVLMGSAAEAADIEIGAIIHQWNDKPVRDALDETSIRWSEAPAATPFMRREQQLTWLPRGAAGDVCRVTYQNPEDAATRTVTLERRSDGFATLALQRPVWSPLDLFASPVMSRALDGGAWYIRVAAIAPTLTTPFPHRDFRNAVNSAVSAGATGLLIDLRGTQGGDAALVPRFLSPLVAERAFYETPAFWDGDAAAFKANEGRTLYVEPHAPAFEGPVAVLVDGYTMGPAESMAAFLQGRENVRVVGETPTYGSPTTPDVELTLPGGYVIYYPSRRSLDAAGNPRGVADAAGAGAVTPDVPIVLDRDALMEIHRERRDIVLERATAVLEEGGG
ncbi:MAG: hypothetical protein KF886_15465 [Candidatus Hydrogenedentes bacterium]|nr:hypothetical protein [Candidatus Hydrogenedentota bacterium]